MANPGPPFKRAYEPIHSPGGHFVKRISLKPGQVPGYGITNWRP
jgi:hypothetical protein